MHRYLSGDQICIGSICVTEEQFRQVFSEEASVAQKQGTETPAQEKTTNQPPTIHLNGNNPAEIQVGDTYNDLGITIKDDHDHNLGYTTLVNGAPTTNNRIKIDTNEPGEHEITYSVTDADGERTTATRTVIIEPLTRATEESPEPPHEEAPHESPAQTQPEQPAPIIEPEPQETPQSTATSTNNNEAPQNQTPTTTPAQP